MSTHIPILSTRKIKAAVTRQALLSGFAIIEYEFIKVSFTGNPDNLEETLVFTSKNAVKAFAAYQDKTGAHTRHHKVYCLQGETLQTLKDINGINIIATAADATSLANKIIDDGEVNKLSFICGHQRRNELPDLLREHGISVEEVKVYETSHTGQPVRLPYAGILFFSPSAVESFFQTNILAPGIPCFSIGPTTAAAVKEHTDNPVIPAEETTQESMLEAVQAFFKKDKVKQNDKIERRNNGSDKAGAMQK